MRKKGLLTAALLTIGASAFAGGYLTNTNQSIYFLRNPARAASIGIDGIYYNPAGAVFYNEGFHFQFNWQNVKQHRDAIANYNGLFKYNIENPSLDGSRKFKGNVDVPIQPSLFALYNKGNWSFQAGFGFMGGGGGCEFNDGVGMFEAMVGSKGMTALGDNFAGYALNSEVTGKSYYMGLSLAAARKLTDNLSISFGLRGIYATQHYNGSIKDMKYKMAAGIVIDQTQNPALSDLVLDCKQTGFGIAPIIGIDYKAADWLNLAVKYEFNTRLTVKSDAKSNAAFDQLASTNTAFAGYLDGAKTDCDMPALFTFGAQFAPIEKLRVDVGYHHYFDVATTQWNKDRLGDTNEFTFGAEYDITDRFEVSAGLQRTIYDQTDANVSDLSFNMTSFSYGFGIGVRVSEKVKVNAAYFQTLYDDYKTPTTTYSRTNRVIGIGVDIAF
ncbi:MAG: hypothetical protein IKP73_15735 [Bacteroidales bacterium]|nr:hypothetical protein [Bacteroidales bacterium]